MFAWDDVSVNGFMCDPFWASSLPAGTAKYAEISFSSSKFEELGIKDVEEIEFVLEMYDDDDFSKPHYVEETFTFKP